MNNSHPGVDQYIEKSPEFAKPILHQLRLLIHELCPEVSEDLKWAAPHFIYRSSALCGIAAFKRHCALFFSKSDLMEIAKTSLTHEKSMGQFGKIYSLGDIPDKKTLSLWIHEAMSLNEKGIKRIINKLNPKKVDAMIHPDFLTALKNSKQIYSAFFSLSPSHRKEYIEYINEAKKPETQKRRIENALVKLNKGLSHNYKYQTKIKKPS